MRADQGSNLAKMEVAPCTQTVKHKRYFTFVNKPKKQSRLDKSAGHYLASREENVLGGKHSVRAYFIPISSNNLKDSN